jgi:hypothetical protein
LPLVFQKTNDNRVTSCFSHLRNKFKEAQLPTDKKQPHINSMWGLSII